jgi:hypothetical protein
MGPEEEEDPPRGVGAVGAAEGAPLSQGLGGSLPLPLDGEDLTNPVVEEKVRGEPVEPLFHAPTTTEIDPLPVATGECTVEVVEAGHPRSGCPEE